MSPNSVVCRICLSGKVHLIPIAGTPLQYLYEKLINTVLYTADNRPVKVCYICHALLKRCYDLMLTASKAENILTSVLQKYPEGYPGLESVIGEHASNLCMKLETIPVDCIDYTSFSEPMSVKSEPPDTNDIPGCDVKDEVDIDLVEDFPMDPYVQPPDVKAEDGIMEYINVLASQETGLVLNTAQVVSTPLSETCLPSTFQPSTEDGSNSTKTEDINSNKRPPVIRLGESPRSCAMETDEKGADYAMKTETEIKKNSRRQAEKPRVTKFYECEVCHYTCRKPAHLKRHSMSHTGEKPYVCHVCSRSFSQKPSLQYHLRTHTNEKPHECDICKKRYSRESTLRLHLKRHTGEKPHECNVCQRHFVDSWELNCHLRVHTDERPHKCIICRLTFNRKDTLRRHLMTHTGEKPLQCNVCSRRFNRKECLRKHIKIRHTDD